MPKCQKNVKTIKIDLPDEVEFSPPPMVYQITKEQLIDLYYGDMKSVRQIASELGRGATTIRRWMEKYNIPRRNYSDATITHYDKQREKDDS
jgi:IS30 family transposase